MKLPEDERPFHIRMFKHWLMQMEDNWIDTSIQTDEETKDE